VSAAVAAPTVGRRRTSWTPFVLHAVLLAGALVMLYPLLWMLASSFKPDTAIFSDPSLVLREVTFQNYVQGWNGLRIPFHNFFINSLTVALSAVIGNVLSCSMAAYAFGRLNFKFKRFWFAIMLVTIMLPHHATLLPHYILFHRLGWVNTYLPLIVPRFLAVDAFFVFLIVQFIRGLPRELDDAAAVDGAGPFQIYLRIILPLAVPALVTTAIFTFIWNWDDFLSQLVYINEIDKYTIPLALRAFLDSTGKSFWGSLFAMSIISLIPTFAFFISCQKMLIEGISTTGLKG
jgi:multiple sugar transport system permease protein